MPAGGGGKGPAGGYRAGRRGSYGCSGYPTVSADGTVHGCHETREQAAAQARAIWASTNAEKADMPLEYFMEKQYRVAENFPGCDGFAVIDDDGELDGCFTTREEAEAYAQSENINDSMDDDMMDKAAPTGTITDPEPATPGPNNTIKEPQMKNKKKKGGAGGDPAGAVVSNGTSMGTKSEFLGFARDVTKVTRLTEVFKRDYSTAERRRMAASGAAMPDGSYPIANEADLRNAIQAFGRTDNPRATKEHIMRRARALGLTDLIPENWR